MSFCKFCGMEIEWVHTPDGKTVPIDPDPVFVIEGSGIDVFYLDEGAEPITGRVARPEEEHRGMEVGFVPHSRTCAWVDRPRLHTRHR